jgi:hypothetical protein
MTRIIRTASTLIERPFRYPISAILGFRARKLNIADGPTSLFSVFLYYLPLNSDFRPIVAVPEIPESLMGACAGRRLLTSLCGSQKYERSIKIVSVRRP